MKTKYSILLLVGIASSSIELVARELRTPLIFQSTFGRAYVHYPVPRPKEDDTCWNFDVIGGAFSRATDVAFTDEHGKTKESLAALWFGKADFTGIEAFAPGSFSAPNPFLNFAQISPRFDYNEKGAWFHFTADRAFCGGRWHVGTRINLPFRYIKTDLDSVVEETLDDVRKFSNERVIDEVGNEVLITNEDVFGYRLDFLASLKTTLNPSPMTGMFVDLVNFRDPDKNNSATIATKVIDETNALVVVGGYTVNPVHVIFREDGSRPPAPCSLRGRTTAGPANPIPVNMLSNLNSNGDGVFTQVNDQNNSLRARFNSGTDYTALKNSVENQSKLWVVPTLVGTGNNANIHPDADYIETEVESIVKTIHTSALGFFQDQGVSFDGQRTVGAGDLDWDFYLQRQWCDPCWGYMYAEGLFGVRFPTGKKIDDPKKLLAVSTGNNGHYELRGGLQGGWEPREWFNLKIDGTYSWVLRRTEKVAAPFRGATIKNIGPTIDADVSWSYFVGNADFTFIAPCSCLAGITIGYNVYVKTEDDVRLCKKTAVDFFGATRQLDGEVLERRTKVVAHKIKTEAFHQGDYWELFGGWSHVVAGKNATRDTDWHIGFAVFF